MTGQSFEFDFFGALERNALLDPDAVALETISGSGESCSRKKFVDETRSLSLYLTERISPGDRVAILMENGPRWGVAFVAAQSAGAIAVPLDTLSSVSALTALIVHAEARMLMASARFAEAATQIQRELATIECLIFDGFEWNAIIQRKCDKPLPHVARTIDDELAILYTGGTTGKPKGVLLTRRNVYRSITDMLAVFPLSPDDRILCALPLHHIMPLLANLLAPLYTGARVFHLAQLDPKLVADAFSSENITAFLCVPQFYYQAQRRILNEIARQPRARQWLFHLMARVSALLRRRFGLTIGRWLFTSIHAKFGSSLRAFGVGGASFNPETAAFFSDLGFQMFQAYGLTECSGLATVTPLDHMGGHNCGKPVAHVEIRVMEPDAGGIGEIAIRGENVMKGYWREPEATAAAVRDGWLYTGDIGTLTPDGALRITGRAKEVIVLSSGKNIFPEEIEEFFLANCTLVQELCITSIEDESGARLHCLAVPDLQSFRNLNATFAEQRIREEIEALSRRLPVHQRPGSLQVISESLPRTTTRKVQRFRAAEIAATYMNGGGSRFGRPAEVPRDPIERGIIDLIRLLRKNAGPITISTSLELDLHLDSLERIELIANIERRFSISIPEANLSQLFNVADLVSIVKSSPNDVSRAGESWRSWSEIILEPLTDAERALAGEYLRPRPVAEAVCYFIMRALRSAAAILVRFRVQVPEEFPDGGFLLCPNHVSYLDDVLSPAAMPFSVFRRMFFLAARKYFSNPVLRWLGRNLRAIPVDPDTDVMSALRMGRAGLERGMVLCVFPEGTRSFDGKLQTFMKGAAALACALRIPAMPMGIAGTFEVMPRNSGFGGFHPVAISAGPPIRPRANESADIFNERLAEAIAAEIRKAAAMRA